MMPLMFDLQIKTNLPQLERELTEFAKKQIPYATARTLTQLAKNAQAEVRRNLPTRFQIRNHFTASGIRIEPARKSDWPNLRSAIGSVDGYLARQELGGRKEGQGGKLIAEPYGIRPNPSMITKPAQWPSRLLKKPGYFKVKLKNKNPLALILYRKPMKGRGRTYRAAAKKAQLMYIQVSHVNVKARWNLRQIVEKVATHKAFNQLFGNYLKDAMQKGITFKIK
jgi:hypothetical protein